MELSGQGLQCFTVKFVPVNDTQHMALDWHPVNDYRQAWVQSPGPDQDALEEQSGWGRHCLQCSLYQ